MAPAAAPDAPAARAPAPTQDFVDDLLSDSLEGAKSVPADDAVAHSVTALLRRANEHVAAKRWPQAAADFRELLRRYPADARAPSWKKQLALVTQGLHDPP
jgi:TolA-binding protein